MSESRKTKFDDFDQDLSHMVDKFMNKRPRRYKQMVQLPVLPDEIWTEIFCCILRKNSASHSSRYGGIPAIFHPKIGGEDCSLGCQVKAIHNVGAVCHHWRGILKNAINTYPDLHERALLSCIIDSGYL